MASGSVAAREAAAVVRKASPADLDAIDAIESASFDADRFPRRNLSRLLKSRSAIFLVEEAAGSVRGYILLLFRKGAKRARLYSLATAGHARGKGVALNLVQAARECIIARGCDRLGLEVRASNAAAIGLYKRAGFNVIGTTPRYYDDGEAALRMELRVERRESSGK